MRFKKIMYVHGFASSGSSGTVGLLHKFLPEVEIVAPDLPTDPLEALDLLKTMASTEKPDVIIGTSMGGMYTQQLRGFHRIIVNPAFNLSEHLKQWGFGKQEFLNNRRDGAKSFVIDSNMLKHQQEIEAHQFEGITPEDDKLVYGLFGTKDPLVHGSDIFCRHYSRCIFFEGEHRMNDTIVGQSVMPVLGWLDDEIFGMDKMRVFIDLETLMNSSSAVDSLGDDIKEKYKGRYAEIPNFFGLSEPADSAIKAFRTLAERFDVYIVCTPPWNASAAWADQQNWVKTHFGVPSYRRLIAAERADMLKGDFLIAAPSFSGAADFEGFHLPFGDAPYQNWNQILLYFENL